MEPIVFAVAIATMLFTAIALYFDLRLRKIPNALTVAAFGIAVVFHTATTGLSGLGFAMAGFAAGFGPLLLLWLIGGGGGGDVKLMGALGAWVGPYVILIVFFGSALLALVSLVTIAFVRIAFRSRAPSSSAASGSSGGIGIASGQFEATQKFLPYAVPVTVMTWAWMLMKVTILIVQ